MRKIYFAKTKMERHYLRLFELALILPTMIIGGSLYYVIFSLMTEQLGVPEVVVTHLTPVVDKVNLILMIVLPIVLLVLFSIGVMLTRNLVGPIERIDRELQEIISGSLFTKRLKLREKDELKDVADAINDLVIKLKSDQSSRLEVIEKLEKQTDKMEETIRHSDAKNSKLPEIVNVFRENIEKLKEK